MSLALRPFERAWAEAIFEAVLGPVEAHGLPAFASIDRDAFWQAVETAPGPSFGLGLRAMLHTLTFLPVTRRGYRAPMYALSRDARMDLLEQLGADDGYAIRQMVTTMKMLASFAYFDAPSVRARFTHEAAR